MENDGFLGVKAASPNGYGVCSINGTGTMQSKKMKVCHVITRMIVGDNPQTGHSYIEDIIPGADMKAFYTPEKILETLFVIQDAGYNAILPLSTPTNLEILKKFRSQGGKLEIIFQPYTAIPLAEMLPRRVIATFLQPKRWLSCRRCWSGCEDHTFAYRTAAKPWVLRLTSMRI